MKLDMRQRTQISTTSLRARRLAQATLLGTLLTLMSIVVNYTSNSTTATQIIPVILIIVVIYATVQSVRIIRSRTEHGLSRYLAWLTILSLLMAAAIIGIMFKAESLTRSLNLTNNHKSIIAFVIGGTVVIIELVTLGLAIMILRR